MPRGGKRPGAGRKQGAATKRTRGIADRLAQTGLMPLEVMLKAMQERYDAEDYERAAHFAEKAAPYLHPRLSSVEHKKPPVDLSKLTDDELQQLRELYRRARALGAGNDGAGALGAGNDRDGVAPPAGVSLPGPDRTRH